MKFHLINQGLPYSSITYVTTGDNRPVGMIEVKLFSQRTAAFAFYPSAYADSVALSPEDLEAIAARTRAEQDRLRYRPPPHELPYVEMPFVEQRFYISATRSSFADIQLRKVERTTTGEQWTQNFTFTLEALQSMYDFDTRGVEFFRTNGKLRVPVNATTGGTVENK